MNPFQNGVRPAPPPDLANWYVVRCACGATEFSLEPFAIIRYNPLRHEEYGIAQGQRLKCDKCGMYPTCEKDERGHHNWVSKASADPMPT